MVWLSLIPLCYIPFLLLFIKDSPEDLVKEQEQKKVHIELMIKQLLILMKLGLVVKHLKKEVKNNGIWIYRNTRRLLGLFA